MVRAHELTRRRPFLILAAACFILGLLGWGFYYARAASCRAPGQRAACGESGRDAAGRRANGRACASRRPRSIAWRRRSLRRSNDRSFWPEIIEDLNARLPKEHIWITELVATFRRTTRSAAGSCARGRVEPTPTADADTCSEPPARPGAAPTPAGAGDRRHFRPRALSV